MKLICLKEKYLIILSYEGFTALKPVVASQSIELHFLFRTDAKHVTKIDVLKPT